MSEHTYEVLESTEHFRGNVFSMLTDRVAMPGGRAANRDYTRHLGAAAVVALDDTNRVVLVRQYRHPVRQYLYEVPAGLCDVHDEPGFDTARRELAEEADIVASTWHHLIDLYTSPGYSDEMLRIYLARDLSSVAEPDRHHRSDEEADMTVHWVDLDEAVAMIFRGEILNGPTAAGLLAAARARDQNWTPLTPAS